MPHLFVRIHLLGGVWTGIQTKSLETLLPLPVEVVAFCALFTTRYHPQN